MMGNTALHDAKRNKNDEFYTQLKDIELEVDHYRHHFKDKVVYLNCDDPESSNFWVYFRDNFDCLGLKGLIATHFPGSYARDMTVSITRRFLALQ